MDRHFEQCWSGPGTQAWRYHLKGPHDNAVQPLTPGAAEANLVTQPRQGKWAAFSECWCTVRKDSVLSTKKGSAEIFQEAQPQGGSLAGNVLTQTCEPGTSSSPKIDSREWAKCLTKGRKTPWVVSRPQSTERKSESWVFQCKRQTIDLILLNTERKFISSCQALPT